MSRQKFEEPKSSIHAGCWIVLILLVSISVAIGYYFYKENSDRNNYELREQKAWMMIEKYDSQEGINMLRKAINRYLRHFPKGRHAEQVKNIKLRVDSERRDWKSTLKHLSVESLEEFVRRHSDGYYRNDASRMIDSLLFVEAKAEDTFQAYQNYLQLYENGRYADDARMRMDELDGGIVSATEENEVQTVVMAHFDALADDDADALLSTIAGTMDSYIGRTHVNKDAVVKYMRSIHEDEGKSVVFTVDDMKVTKSAVDHIPVFTAEFLLFETITKGESNVQKSFMATAVLDDKYMITSLKLVAGE